MSFDYKLSIAGLIVGIVVGLTGMGGGALMTPILVIFFNTNPAAAVSSDLVTSLFMKPIGGAIHWRRATVHRSIVRWLLVPAVPAAFAGVFLLRALGGAAAADRIKLVLGIALVLAFLAMILRLLLARPQTPGEDGLDAPVRRLPTVLIGLLGGLVVGMTSVGSGSMIIVALMFVYPRLSNRALVGTDLVQAVPLVGAAALGHVFFGDVQLSITTSLLVGALPGVFIGAQISSRTTAPWLRPVLAAVLLASAMKLLNVPSVATGVIAVSVGIVLLLLPQLLRRTGVPRWARAPQAEEDASRAHLSEV
ncbi:MAG: uncharacterized protein QOJ03_841 [Frankiaceae bacterium]|nr:uncharacterized protein [Frankiaceae bacterium]